MPCSACAAHSPPAATLRYRRRSRNGPGRRRSGTRRLSRGHLSTAPQKSVTSCFANLEPPRGENPSSSDHELPGSCSFFVLFVSFVIEENFGLTPVGTSLRFSLPSHHDESRPARPLLHRSALPSGRDGDARRSRTIRRRSRVSGGTNVLRSAAAQLRLLCGSTAACRTRAGNLLRLSVRRLSVRQLHGDGAPSLRAPPLRRLHEHLPGFPAQRRPQLRIHRTGPDRIDPRAGARSGPALVPARRKQ